MKRIWILLLILMLAGCTPTPCPPCPPCETATPTFTPTTTPSATPSATTTPEALVTLTPTPTITATLGPVDLRMEATPAFPAPATLVSIMIVWTGGPAEIALGSLPLQTCCPDPEQTVWQVDGPAEIALRVWVFSNATGIKTFSTVARVDGEIVKMAAVSVTVAGTTFTPTPVITATPTHTTTPSVMWRMEPRTWHYVENPARLPLLWLYNASFPVGGPGGQIWSYDPSFAQMDWEVAGGHGWLILETNRGDVWLWVDTIRRLDVAAMKFTARAW